MFAINRVPYTLAKLAICYLSLWLLHVHTLDWVAIFTIVSLHNLPFISVSTNYCQFLWEMAARFCELKEPPSMTEQSNFDFLYVSDEDEDEDSVSEDEEQEIITVVYFWQGRDASEMGWLHFTHG